MPFKYTDEELLYSIQSLSEKQRKALSKKLRPEYIKQTFDTIKATIAQEAKQRIQSKIAITFIRGYSKGDLFNSIYTQIEGDKIIVKSTKSYFAILNDGIKSWDMKEKFAGRTVKMRLPGGKVIFRKVPAADTPKEQAKKKNQPISKTGGWIYPGYSGVHIYETVAKEMETWTKTYVRNAIQELIRSAGAEDYSFAGTEEKYYNNRGANGRFIKKTSSYSTLFKDDLSSFGYTKLQNGSIVPKSKRLR
jgi:hypothetical protein